jgi:hypothetical protein
MVVTGIGNLRSQCPTYSLNNASGNYTLGCNPGLVVVDAINTSSVPINNYHVSPARGTNILSTNGNTVSVGFSLPGTYTITSDSWPISWCVVSQTITIYPNALAPIINVTPSSATAICNGPLITFSASSSSTNVTGVWYQDILPSFVQPNNLVPLSPPGSSITFSTSAIGVYMAVFTDNVTGCVNSSVVAVNGSSVVGNVIGSASPSAYLPCANNSVVLTGGLSVSIVGPITYTWTNLTTSISVFPPTGGYTVTTPGYYKLDVIDGMACLTSQIFYVGTNTVAPIINVSGNSNVCQGTSSNLYANGAVSYSWSTGATTSSINVLPSSTTVYTLSGANYSCSAAPVTITVNVNSTCSDVWPGDASSDGVANLTDVLEIGLQSGFTGPARTATSIAWSPYFANNWTGTITNLKNRCHADCDGDGIVNATDVNAITANWGLTHTFKLSNEDALSPELTIIADQPAVQIGKWGTASIFLGDATNSINLYGLAFDINHNNTLIETDSIYIEYLSSFLNAGGTNIEFQKGVFMNSVLYAASTRTDHADVNGNGKIGILHFKAVSTLTSNAVLNLSASIVNKTNASGNFSSLTNGAAASVTISTSAIGINEFKNFENNISIYPQPAKEVLNISSNSFYGKEVIVKVYDITGKLMSNEKVVPSNDKTQLQISNLSDGVYILQIKNSKNETAVKRLIITK